MFAHQLHGPHSLYNTGSCFFSLKFGDDKPQVLKGESREEDVQDNEESDDANFVKHGFRSDPPVKGCTQKEEDGLGEVRSGLDRNVTPPEQP